MEKPLSHKEKILLAQAAKERSDIITRYDKGRENNAHLDIDPWDDPEMKVYQEIDRYGFICEGEVEKDKEKGKMAEIENARVKKWLKMLEKEHWFHYFPSDKLTRRIYKGIPSPVRGLVWSKLLDVSRLSAENKGVYDKMKTSGRQWSLEVRQVDLDVNRTFRDHIMFRKRYDVKQQALFNILVAYSMYNSEVGYCQGMSQIAALILMYLNEEDAFWALVSLMNEKKHKMHGFFVHGFPKLLRYQEHFNKVLKKYLPKIKKHLDKNEMYPCLYTIKWFLQCFLDRIPFTLTLRFWDIYFLEGENVLIAMALTIIKLHRNRILKMNMEELMDFFQNRLSKEFDHSDDHTISVLKTTLEELKRAKLDVPPITEESERLERTSKPLGVIEAPTVEQMINEMEKESGNSQGSETDVSQMQQNNIFQKPKVNKRVKSSRLEIPADGGPDVIPLSFSQRFSQMIDLESESGTGDDNWREVMSEATATSDRRSSETSFTGSEFPSPGIPAATSFSPLKKVNTGAAVISPTSKSLVVYRYCKIDSKGQSSSPSTTSPQVRTSVTSSEKRPSVERHSDGITLPPVPSRSSSSSSINSQPHLMTNFGRQIHMQPPQLQAQYQEPYGQWNYQGKSLMEQLKDLNDIIPEATKSEVKSRPKTATARLSTTSTDSTPIQKATFDFHIPVSDNTNNDEELVVHSPVSPPTDSPNSMPPYSSGITPSSMTSTTPTSLFSVDSLDMAVDSNTLKLDDSLAFSEKGRNVSNYRPGRHQTTVCVTTLTSNSAPSETPKSNTLKRDLECSTEHHGSSSSLTSKRPFIISNLGHKGMQLSPSPRKSEAKAIPIQHIVNATNSAPPYLSNRSSLQEKPHFNWSASQSRQTLFWSAEKKARATRSNSVMMPIPVLHMRTVPVIPFRTAPVDPENINLSYVRTDSLERPSTPVVCQNSSNVSANVPVVRADCSMPRESIMKFSLNSPPRFSPVMKEGDKAESSANLRRNMNGSFEKEVEYEDVESSEIDHLNKSTFFQTSVSNNGDSSNSFTNLSQKAQNNSICINLKSSPNFNLAQDLLGNTLTSSDVTMLSDDWSKPSNSHKPTNV